MSGDPVAPRAVLVVDDDSAIRNLLSALLRRQGFQTDTAEDGGIAIAKLGAKKYSLILLDLMMPEVDGFAVLEFMRSTGDRTPVIVVTAAGPTATKSLVDYSIATTIRKPFDVNELADVVGTHALNDSLRGENAS